MSWCQPGVASHPSAGGGGVQTGALPGPRAMPGFALLAL